MSEEQAVREKILVIDIKLTRGLVVALSCVLVLAALVIPDADGAQRVRV